MGAAQPYMYSRAPEATFDPKSVTRASWEPKPKKPQHNGPLISFNRHPDAHMVLTTRSGNFSSMSPRTKQAIKCLRRIQVGLRVLELNGAIGLLVLMILFTKVDAITGWVLRIAPGVVIAHCLYGAYHLSRDAAGRAPASSAAYQLFATVGDLCVLGVYAFGAYTVYYKSDDWATRLESQKLMDSLVPAVYYTFIGAGGLHLVSLCISSWLGFKFRQISLMPPDMNPLEDNLTARPKHKRGKSSVTTLSTIESEKRLSTPLENHRRSGVPYEDISRPPTVPFMHTRTQSRESLASRNSRADLPSRHYQVAQGNPSRYSVASIESKRLSAPRYAQRGSYAELPLNDPNTSQTEATSPGGSSQHRPAKFTETWIPTNSLISRTNQRNREIAAAQAIGHARGTKSYSALSQRYNLDDSSEDEYNDENKLGGSDVETDLSSGRHPNPLGAHPPAASRALAARVKTPFQPWSNSLSEISTNERRVSASRDIADQKYAPANTARRNQDDSIYPDIDSDMYAKPYGELKSATPPVMIGNARNVSSGNDYDAKHSSVAFERRNVSGKIAEEGRAGDRVSRSRFLTGRM